MKNQEDFAYLLIASLSKNHSDMEIVASEPKKSFDNTISPQHILKLRKICKVESVTINLFGKVYEKRIPILFDEVISESKVIMVTDDFVHLISTFSKMGKISDVLYQIMRNLSSMFNIVYVKEH